MLNRMNRRTALSSASLVALAPTIPNFLTSTARASTGSGSSSQRILVVVQLSGGNDGLNTIVPYADELYPKYRQQLKVPNDQVIKLDGAVGLHPSLRPFKELLDDDRLSIVQSVGYPNPNRSHDVSMSIWQTARLDPSLHQSYGWLGRAMDQRMRPANGASDMMLIGNQSIPVAIRGRKSRAAALNSLQEMKRSQTSGSVTAVESNDLESYVSRSMLSAYATSDLIESIAESKRDTQSNYPGSNLGRRLKTIAGLIKSEFGTPAYYAIQGGYDTHSAQPASHPQLLRELSRAVKAFSDDMKASGLDERVLVMCFSEFGRRVQENGSIGTDHGTAGPMFLIGPKVNPGLIGEPADLANLVDGDLDPGIDFRSVYADVLQNWLAIDSENAVGGKFDPVSVIAKA